MAGQERTPRPKVVKIRNPLGVMNDVEIRESVHNFHESTSQTLTGLRPYPSEQEIRDAATVFKHHDIYYNAAYHNDPNTPIQLNATQRRALVKEADHTFSERGTWMVIVTVSLSAFLQGFMQSSQNGANLFADLWINISDNEDVNSGFAIANAAVYFSAAALGCPLAAAVNSYFGRRGAIFIASLLIFASSLGSAAIELHDQKRMGLDAPDNKGWVFLSGIRIIGGIGMGLKAVSTPILAAETAVGFWRGSFVLMWQLWVSFGIMMSFIVNIGLNHISDAKLKLRLILASPAVFALLLMLIIFKCPESFRYYMTPDSGHYSPEKAFGSLMRLRNTKIQATRDLFLTHVGIEQEIQIEMETNSTRAMNSNSLPANTEPPNGQPVPGNNYPLQDPAQSPRRQNRHLNAEEASASPGTMEHRSGWLWGIVDHIRNMHKAIWHYIMQYATIFTKRRLRNAAIASGVVALAQQLSGSMFVSLRCQRRKVADFPTVNIMAFYGGSILVEKRNGFLDDGNVNKAMVYNVIFGLLNFLFCLPAIHYVDKLGRRKILLFTIPWAAAGLMAAAVSFGNVKIEVVAFWLYFHAVWYSPGMGPVPFILAAESFPLAFRETGASIAVSINFLFAGFLAWLQPLLNAKIGTGGTLGLFSGFNVVAFVLIFLLVEETGGVRLEALGLVFREPKRSFIRFQLFEFLPWLGRFLIGKSGLHDRPRRMLNYEKRGVDIIRGDDEEQSNTGHRPATEQGDGYSSSE